jgi:hypothetical protein
MFELLTVHLHYLLHKKYWMYRTTKPEYFPDLYTHIEEWRKCSKCGRVEYYLDPKYGFHNEPGPGIWLVYKEKDDE